MAEVDGQINLVVLWDVKDVLLVLHVNCHELVADLRGMLGVVHRAEQLSLDVLLEFHVRLKLDAFALDLLAPSVLVKALSEKDDISEDSAVVILVDPITHPVKVERKDLIHEHVLAVPVCQAVVISLPFLRVRSRGKLLRGTHHGTVAGTVHLLEVAV